MKKKTTIWLDDIQLRGLDALTKSSGAPKSEIIRRAINAYLENHIRKLAKAERTVQRLFGKGAK